MSVCSSLYDFKGLYWQNVTIHHLIMKQGISVLLSVQTDRHFSLGRLVAGDPRECSVEFGPIWTCNMFNINTFKINSVHSSIVLHLIGGQPSDFRSLCRLTLGSHAISLGSGRKQNGDA